LGCLEEAERDGNGEEIILTPSALPVSVVSFYVVARVRTRVVWAKENGTSHTVPCEEFSVLELQNMNISQHIQSRHCAH